MNASRTTFALLLLALPLHTLTGQGQTALPPKMTPEQRAATQAQLDSQVARLSSKALDIPRKQLLAAVIVMRDSIQATIASGRRPAASAANVQPPSARQPRR
jgi:hypothetical protein